MSLIDSVLRAALGITDSDDELRTKPNRADYRRAGQRRGPRRHARPRVRHLEHEVWSPDTLRRPELTDAQQRRLDVAYEANEKANAELPDGEQPTPWIYPWEERFWRNRRDRRRRDRQNRKAGQRSRR